MLKRFDYVLYIWRVCTHWPQDLIYNFINRGEKQRKLFKNEEIVKPSLHGPAPIFISMANVC